MKPSEIIEFEEKSCHQKNESTICSVIVFCKDLRTGCFVSLKVILKWESQGRIAKLQNTSRNQRLPSYTPKKLMNALEKKLTNSTNKFFFGYLSLYLNCWVF